MRSFVHQPIASDRRHRPPRHRADAQPAARLRCGNDAVGRELSHVCATNAGSFAPKEDRFRSSYGSVQRECARPPSADDHDAIRGPTPAVVEKPENVAHRPGTGAPLRPRPDRPLFAGRASSGREPCSKAGRVAGKCPRRWLRAVSCGPKPTLCGDPSRAIEVDSQDQSENPPGRTIPGATPSTELSVRVSHGTFCRVTEPRPPEITQGRIRIFVNYACCGPKARCVYSPRGPVRDTAARTDSNHQPRRSKSRQ